MPLHFETNPRAMAVGPSRPVRPYHQSLVPRQPPSHDRRLDGAAGFVIVPSAVDEVAGKRQLIGPAMILAQNLDRHARRRHARAVEISQSSFTCSHLYSPKARRAHAAFQKHPRPKSQRRNEVAM